MYISITKKRIRSNLGVHPSLSKSFSDSTRCSFEALVLAGRRSSVCPCFCGLMIFRYIRPLCSINVFVNTTIITLCATLCSSFARPLSHIHTFACRLRNAVISKKREVVRAFSSEPFKTPYILRLPHEDTGQPPSPDDLLSAIHLLPFSLPSPLPTLS
ncbi:hypothetical protein HDK90DRAFT_8955 [Phyllosticta capitalensis]|uniref:Uncharacterized protein n=1 Tax=Phyllosticta capitalensis TaxID=121624 RepID=A0ABR1Z1V6_9PEZI